MQVLSHTSESIIFLLFGIAAFSLGDHKDDHFYKDIAFWFFSYFFCTGLIAFTFKIYACKAKI